MVDLYKVHGELVLLHNYDYKSTAGISSSVTKTFYFEDFLRGIKNLLDKHEKSVLTVIVENKVVSQKEIKLASEKVKLGDYLLQQDPNTPNLTLEK